MLELKTTTSGTEPHRSIAAVHVPVRSRTLCSGVSTKYDLMFQSMVRDAKGGVNQILYWSGLSDWKNQYLTPNPDTIYFMPFFSTKDAGPMVIEIPPADEGSITGGQRPDGFYRIWLREK